MIVESLHKAKYGGLTQLYRKAENDAFQAKIAASLNSSQQLDAKFQEFKDKFQAMMDMQVDSGIILANLFLSPVRLG
jgi:hypothetical protein